MKLLEEHKTAHSTLRAQLRSQEHISADCSLDRYSCSTWRTLADAVLGKVGRALHKAEGASQQMLYTGALLPSNFLASGSSTSPSCDDYGVAQAEKLQAIWRKKVRYHVEVSGTLNNCTCMLLSNLSFEVVLAISLMYRRIWPISLLLENSEIIWPENWSNIPSHHVHVLSCVF